MRSIGFVDLWCSFLSWAHTTQQSLLWFLSFLLLRRTLLILVKKIAVNAFKMYTGVLSFAVVRVPTGARPGSGTRRGRGWGWFLPWCAVRGWGGDWNLGIGSGTGGSNPPAPPRCHWLRVLKFSLDNLELDHKRARLLSYIILNLKYKRVKLDCEETNRTVIRYHHMSRLDLLVIFQKEKCKEYSV